MINIRTRKKTTKRISKVENYSKNELRARREIVKGRVKNTVTSLEKVIDLSLETASTVCVASLSALSSLIWTLLKEESLLWKENANGTIEFTKKKSKARRRNKWSQKKKRQIKETGTTQRIKGKFST